MPIKDLQHRTNKALLWAHSIQAPKMTRPFTAEKRLAHRALIAEIADDLRANTQQLRRERREALKRPPAFMQCKANIDRLIALGRQVPERNPAVPVEHYYKLVAGMVERAERSQAGDNN